MKKKTKAVPSRTYEEEVLSVLAFEPGSIRHAESERKIKRRLREKKLGPYDQARIDALRRFNNELRWEIGKHAASEFYKGAHGKYADMQDWHLDRLRDHMTKRHRDVPKAAIDGFLGYSIYLHYLR